LGAVVLEGRHIAHVEPKIVLTGLVCAAVAGYAAIGFLLKHIPRTGLWPYAIYRIVLAALVLALWFTKPGVGPS
jgi:undecaprenyl pyrophosphate phosphatase UppP